MASLLRTHCLRDVEYFARHFLPHLCRLEFSPFHRELFIDRALHIAERLPDREGRRQALAAPRGNAKSTLKTLIFLLHDLAYGLEPYILVFSATLPQAEQRLRNLRRELETNDSLMRTFPETLARTGPFNRRSLHVGGALIEARSAGSEVRGITFGQWRPTKIILDDIEDSGQVENPLLRQRLHDWFREVIENLGDRYTHIDIVGTVLHPDGLLAHLLERPDFEARRWRSIARFSEQTQLWDEWIRRYIDLANPRRVAAARRYFNTRKADMLAGTEVLWPEKEDYYELMTQMAARGRRAFYKEKQNEPLRADTAIFDPATFRWFRRDGNAILESETSPKVFLSDMRIVGFLDSAMGRSRSHGDYASIATVGIDTAGRLYVLDVWLDRATPSEQARRVLQQHDLWNYAAFGIESVGFQGLIREPIEALRRQRNPPPVLPLVEMTPLGSKIQRVAALEPLIHNGWMLFDRSLNPEFLAQLEQFPGGRHDDGPDALASAVELARRPTRIEPRLLNKSRPSHRTRFF